MKLPIAPPYPPMEAQNVETLPEGEKWQYEPKWDGFRCLVFRDGDEVQLQSKAGQPLARYFPEIVEAVLSLAPKKFVLDGELVIPIDGTLSFDDMLQRIHPAASRIKTLSEKTPATLVVFDLLVDDEVNLLTDQTLAERRPRLEKFAKQFFTNAALVLSPVTTDAATAQSWFAMSGGGLDGLVAKRLDCKYMSGERTGMKKMKALRTVDCVVGGFRYASKGRVIGSLLLGLYDDDGELQHIGVSARFTATRRAELWQELQPLVCDIADHPWGRWNEFLTANPDRVPGTQSRWSAGKDLGFTALRPERVLEVKYDHMEGRRFRHTAHYKRWRTDRDPESCGYGQLDEPAGYDLTRILSTDTGGAP